MKKKRLVVGLMIFLLAVTAGCATEEQDIDNENRTNLQVKAKLPQEFSDLELNANKFVYKVNKSKKTSSNQQVVLKGVSGDKIEVKVSVKDKSGSILAKGTKQVKLANSSVTKVQVEPELLPGDVKLKVTPNKAGTVKYSISNQSDSFDISSETKSVALKDVNSGYKNLEISLNSDERDRTVKVMPNDTAVVEVDFTEEEKEDDSVFSSKSIENDLGVAKLEWELDKEVKGYNIYRSKVKSNKGEQVNRDLIKDRNFFVDKYLRERDDYFYRIEAVRSDKDNIMSNSIKLRSSEMDKIREFPKVETMTLQAGETLTYDMNSLPEGERVAFIVTDTDHKGFRFENKNDIPEYNVKVEKYFNGRFYDEPEQRPTDEDKYPDYSKVHEPELDGDYKTESEWNDTDLSASAVASNPSANDSSSSNLKVSASNIEDVYDDLEGLERNKTGEPIIQRELDVGEKFNMFQIYGGPIEFKVLAKSEHAYFVLQDTFYDGNYDDEEFEFDNYVSDSEVQDSIETFENDIFPTVMENFAEYDYDYYDVNNDGRMMIVFGYISDRKDSPAGAFHAKELPYDHPDNPKTSGIEGSYYGENEMDMVYINIQRLVDLRELPYETGSESTAISWEHLSTQVVAHEFTHWINNYESYKEGMSTEKITEMKTVWIDEGLTSLSEYLTGYEKPGTKGVEPTETILTSSSSPMTGWPEDNNPGAYIRKLGFSSYLYEKYGQSAIKDIAGSKDYIEAIEDVADKSFTDVVLDYATTGLYNYHGLNYRSDDFDVYDFYDIDLRTLGSNHWEGFDGWKYNQLLERNTGVDQYGHTSFGFKSDGTPGKVRISADEEVKVRIINFNKAK